jgi:uncharacterized protein with FMN-binding domain
MPRRLVALSASAVAAVYFAGWRATRAADATLPGTPSPGRAGGAAPGAGVTTTSGAAPGAAVAPSAAVGLSDGTYNGSGMSRRGGVDVSVTIQDGRIASVAITGGTTQYPLSRIAALPGQVVARQGLGVDRVTGATYSAQAFLQAVGQALARASAPAAPGGPGPADSVAPPALVPGGSTAPVGRPAPGGTGAPAPDPRPWSDDGRDRRGRGGDDLGDRFPADRPPPGPRREALAGRQAEGGA